MITDFIDTRSANVYGIYGHLGGGKSLTAVEICLWGLRRGYTVVSNIQLFHVEHLKGKYQFIQDIADVDPWALPCGAPRGSADEFRTIIVIDECAEFFDQYSSTSAKVKTFLSWLRHSSKRGQFVFLIVQAPEFIAKSLRLLVNKWICCLDMQQFRLPMIRCRIPFTSNYVFRRMFDKYGNLISRGANFARKDVIGYFYNTAQSVATEGRGNDHVVREDTPPLGIEPFEVLLIILVVVCFFFL